ncbi:hypothetical protein [Glycomyces sp. NPDC047010]|uniref:hypothetical protein n=1 Tax=Glycomyces sp. NPDC047010 TaxID=3155023 RepID=UPI00340D5F17
MQNPAEDLLALLKSWEPSGPTQSTAAARGVVNNEDGSEFWANHRRAVECLLAIERQLDEMEQAGDDVEAYREYVPAWYRAVFAPKYNWFASDANLNTHRRGTGPDGGRDLAKDTAAMLKGLASHIRTWQIAESIPAGVIADLLEAVDEAEGLIDRATDLPDLERRYVLRLVQQVREVIRDVDLFGRAENRRLVIELGGAMTIVYAFAAEEDKPKAQNVVGRFLRGGTARVTGVALDAGVVLGVQALAAHFSQAIGN